MKPEHKIFADAVINGTSEKDAYKLAYPSATEKSCLDRGRKLSNNVEIGNYIRQIQSKIQNKVENKLSEAISNEIVIELLTVAKKREILSKIANGEMVIEKAVGSKFGVEIVDCKPDAMDIMKAIDLDNKMCGIYINKIAQTDTNGNDVLTEQDISEIASLVNKLNAQS
jgi:hypothetical protein